VVAISDQHQGDAELYRRIVAKMRAGESYYDAAVSEHRANHYPLQPSYVVRLPFLASFLALLPTDAACGIILALLAVIGIAVWSYRLLDLKLCLAAKVFMAMIMVSGSISAMAGDTPAMFHEVWAGQLIFLSLALRTERRFAASALLGLLAALIRELAMPYLAAMALLALWEKRWREAAAFASALAVVAGALAVHASHLQTLAAPDDLPTSGWLAFGGWPFVLSTAKWNMFSLAVGPWVTALLVPLALLGAAATGGPSGNRLLLIIGGYTLSFIIVGRPDNDYWGLIIAPLDGLALAFAPLALWTLQQRATSGFRQRAGY
jgi:hypothetical protein